jgi:xylan 1,4-beta-xylosidase
MKPYVELGFMPSALASGGTTVFHYAGNVTPPKDIRQWSALMRGLGRHLVDRYGIGEVSQWYFEVWNEPNLTAFWTGSQADYFALYRATARALKGVDAALRVGGPSTAQGAWVDDFVAYGKRHRVPIDFISTHYYPTDALGTANTNTTEQLAGAPRGIMRTRAFETKRSAGGRPIVYSEWNTTSNPNDALHDRAFGAAFATEIVMSVADVVDGYSYWTFSDIFEENYFPSVPFHGGFGLLTLHGIAKPTYRAFEILHHLGDERLEVVGTHRTVKTWVVRRGRSVTILCVNNAMPRHPIHQETVDVTLTSSSPPRTAFIERIDDDHTNPRARWEAMGAPTYPSVDECRALELASRLAREPHPVRYVDGAIHARIVLPPHAVAAVTIETARGES